MITFLNLFILVYESSFPDYANVKAYSVRAYLSESLMNIYEIHKPKLVSYQNGIIKVVQVVDMVKVSSYLSINGGG